ncbi:hypothetical protein Tco_0763664 [Tanacetum coccineum]
MKRISSIQFLKGQEIGYYSVSQFHPYVSLTHVHDTVYSENAAEVWKELKDTYDKLDGSILFNLMQKINNFKQNGLLVSEYYHKQNSLWREFGILAKFSPCTCNARTELGKYQQLMNLMQFLMKLDDVYQPIRSSLLAQPELPDVKDAFVIVCREESHRGLGSTSGVQKP